MLDEQTPDMPTSDSKTNRFAKYGKNISIRVSDSLYEEFRQIAAQNNLTRTELFEEFISNLSKSADKESAKQLKNAHNILTETVNDLEKQLFTAFRTFSEAAEAASNESDELKSLRQENEELHQLNLILQKKLLNSEDDVRYQKEMIDYLTVELEKLRSGDTVVTEDGNELQKPQR